MISPLLFSKKMLAFYDQHGRKELPWQLNKTAYSVWVSEIMLQQTQVKTVIPYYLNFMKSFKSVNVLADANLDKVLKHWEGLGYYSRARNLHACAKQVVENFDSEFPRSLDEINSLPGIGESTGGAILSLAYGLPEAILDGNVKRVLARVFLIDGWYGNAKVSKELWQISRKYTPNKRTGDFNQAMMDLGAGICNRANPQCDICPLSKHCKANLQSKTAEYPHRKPKKKIPTKGVTMLLSLEGDKILLHKRPPTGIWGGLWSLPEQKNIDVASSVSIAGKFKHTFSHYHLNATVVSTIQSPIKPPIKNTQKNHQIEDNSNLAWHNIDELNKLALPTPIKRFLYKHLAIKEELI